MTRKGPDRKAVSKDLFNETEGAAVAPAAPEKPARKRATAPSGEPAKAGGYLSIKQVMARYGVSRATIWRWASDVSGFPKPIKFSNGCTRWCLEELRAYDGEMRRAAQRLSKAGKGA
ncbi:AlpA family phage regulatory protein [Alphaproteobacteria bacterium KMM 3653]|uniref:AlpA family phage regulatory protein n=1 Tax=Harenicola maris TaxID=2841044 RepID=A0AAP2CQ14_9RHOB|nr:AlpA family phage regulatory protein [Harenicola maris]